MADTEFLFYASCDTCKKARKWLQTNGVTFTERPIVEQPPTLEELSRWVPASGKSLRQWLNTSGQSYRALGKPAIDAMSEEQLRKALHKDGKLVKRPVLVHKDKVLVGFDPAQYAQLFGVT